MTLLDKVEQLLRDQIALEENQMQRLQEHSIALIKAGFCEMSTTNNNQITAHGYRAAAFQLIYTKILEMKLESKNG